MSADNLGRPQDSAPDPQPPQAYPPDPAAPGYLSPTAPYSPPANYYPPPPYPPPYAYYQAPPRSIAPFIILTLLLGLLIGGTAMAGYFLITSKGTGDTSLAPASPTPASLAAGKDTPEPTHHPPAPTPLPTAAPAKRGATTTPAATPSSDHLPLTPYPQPKPLHPGDQPAPTPVPVFTNQINGTELADQQQAMGDAYKGDVAKLDDPSEYHIVATVSLKDRRISATEAITYTNNTGVPLAALYLRTWPNNPAYHEGKCQVEGVKVDGATAEFDDRASSGTVLAVKLKQPLAPEHSVHLDIYFTDTVPTTGGGYGMYGYRDGVMSLAAWYPLMAVYDDRGWNLDPPGGQGDPDFSEVSLYDVTLTLPPGAKAATSGSAIGSANPNGDSTVTQRYVSGPMREFTMVISDKFALTTADAGGVKVNSWYMDSDAKYGQQVATYTANAIKQYSTMFGPYPYKEVDAVEVPLSDGAGGVEFPGLVYLDSHLYRADAASNLSGGISLGMGEDRVLEFTTAHEIGHQWWYGMVGSNPQRYAFLDEGLVQYSAALYFAKQYGEADFKQQFDLWCVLQYQAMLMMGSDDVLDQPTAHWNDDQLGYSGIVYGKGPLFFHALRQKLGDAAFFQTLQTYWQTYKYQLATPERFIAVAAQVSGRDLSDFYNHWLLEQHGAEDIKDYAVDLGGLGGLGGSNPFGDAATPTP